MKGYKAQSELVLAQLEPLLADFVARGESAIVEGAHLSLNLVVRLLARHPAAVPFLITISNEAKHRERFAVRAKYMSLAPEANRYVKYFRQIRTIQDYLVGRAARHSIPSLNNTNVDRSVDVIHACAFGFARREALGADSPPPFDGMGTSTQRLLAEYIGLLTVRALGCTAHLLGLTHSPASLLRLAAPGVPSRCSKSSARGAALSTARARPATRPRPRAMRAARTTGTRMSMLLLAPCGRLLRPRQATTSMRPVSRPTSLMARLGLLAR